MDKNTNKNNSTKFSYFISSALSNWGFTWAGLLDNRNGEWLLFTQLGLIAAHVMPAWPNLKIPISYFNEIIITSGNILFITGLFFAIKSLLNLGSSLSPLPEPKKHAQLVTSGCYQYCRHPLYQSLLIMSFGIAISYLSILHLIIMLLLAKILQVKAKREENRLLEIHSLYKDYMKKTVAIIPGLKFLDWRQ